jgi:thiol-disulfide isomerase/thioredoxin
LTFLQATLYVTMTEFITRVRDAEQWAQLKDASNKRLLGAFPVRRSARKLDSSFSLAAVVDVHKDWCGPCKIMEPTYKRIAADIDRPDQRFVIASVGDSLELFSSYLRFHHRFL